jgi:hypothetical protein
MGRIREQRFWPGHLGAIRKETCATPTFDESFRNAARLVNVDDSLPAKGGLAELTFNFRHPNHTNPITVSFRLSDVEIRRRLHDILAEQTDRTLSEIGELEFSLERGLW